MKIALIGPVFPYRGGIAHYTTMLCRAFREAGHTVLLVSFKRQYPRRLYPGQSDRDPSQTTWVVDDARYWIDSLNPFTWLQTFHRIRAYSPDIVVLPWWTTFLAPAWITLAALQRVFLRRPLVIICHNVLPHDSGMLARWVARAVLGFGTRLIVQSDAEEQRLSALVPGKQVEVVPHPVHDMYAGQRVRRELARAKLGLAQETPVLLFFGIVRKYKGLSDILLALPEVHTHLGQVRLLIAGEFWEDKRTNQELIEQLGIGELVMIEDHYIPNEEVPLYFGAADLLVAPYRTVTGSSVVQLAVGFDLPVVTTADVPLRTDADRKLIHIVPRSELARAIVDCLAESSGPRAVENSHSVGATGWQALVVCITKDAAA